MPLEAGRFREVEKRMYGYKSLLESIAALRDELKHMPLDIGMDYEHPAVDSTPQSTQIERQIYRRSAIEKRLKDLEAQAEPLTRLDRSLRRRSETKFLIIWEMRYKRGESWRAIARMIRIGNGRKDAVFLLRTRLVERADEFLNAAK